MPTCSVPTTRIIRPPTDDASSEAIALMDPDLAQALQQSLDVEEQAAVDRANYYYVGCAQGRCSVM